MAIKKLNKIDLETDKVIVSKTKAKATSKVKNTTLKDYEGLYKLGIKWSVPNSEKTFLRSGDAAVENYNIKNG